MACSKNAALQLSYCQQGVCEAISNLALVIQLPFHAKLHVFIFQSLFLEKLNCASCFLTQVFHSLFQK